MRLDDGPVRWGILGTGWIATDWAADLRLLPDARLVAVGSRRAETAAAFVEKASGDARPYGSYAELCADPEVEAVYVATPHTEHFSAALAAIEAGKAVLVEKPFTVDAAEAAELVAAARARGVVLLEAMWTRFLPHMATVRQLIASGRLGDVQTVLADHGQWFAPDASHRLFAPELGGGALLDLGVYPVSFASMVLGQPRRVTAVSDPAFTGVDAQTSVLLQYGGGAHAVLTTTLSAVGPTRAAVVGTDARIEIGSKWYAPAPITLIPRSGEPEVIDLAVDGKGLRYAAAEVGRLLRVGALESPLLPLDETVAVMATMDEIRRQIGLVHPTAAGG